MLKSPRFGSLIVFSLWTFISLLCFATSAFGQNCAPITNFAAVQYNPTYAIYQWDDAEGVEGYKLEVKINNQIYLTVGLPSGSTAYEVQFVPILQHNDLVETTLTRQCSNGAQSSATVDFIIIVDIIVYLIGDDPGSGGAVKVEPVFTTNDNLVPNNKVCGKCSPSYFRLTSGFYGPFGISVDQTLAAPIEFYRFDKNELCECLENAINTGILDPNGGPGPNYGGEPFTCKITPYSFLPEDCDRQSEGRTDAETTIPVNDLLAVPNPAADGSTQLRFNLENDSKISITLYDILGVPVKTIFHGQSLVAGNHNIEVQTSGLPSGMYFCAVDNGQTADCIKISVLSN